MKRFLIAPLFAATASGGDISLSIEIPRLEVAEYHRPYVAAWIEKPDGSFAANLAVWYDVGMKDKEGETWLKDIRQWWRKSGRSLKLPVDGVSGPTRPVGVHTITIPSKVAELPPLAEGSYQVVVEAAREVGGREMLKLPFKWDGKTAAEASTQGKTELGKIQFSIKAETPN
jgi:hypothetical protein